MKKMIIFYYVLGLFCLQTRAQSADKLKEFLSSALKTYGLSNPMQVKDFYNYNGFNFFWLTEDRSKITPLLNYIRQSPQLGLREKDYQPALFKEYFTASYLASGRDSLLNEIKFTDAAIHFIHDLLMGNESEPLSYNGINYSPSCFNIPEILSTYFKTESFSSLLKDLEPKDAEYISIRNRLNFFQRMLSDENFKETIITSSKLANTNTALLKRLFQLGLTDSETQSLTENHLKSKIKEAQNLVALVNDGRLNSPTIKAMNVRLSVRVKELEKTLNSLRWISCIKQAAHIIVVNIPSATLLLYEHGKIVLESKIIVGKRSTPTPILASKITEVILYPYWNVPLKIAVTELLPKIKRNPGYLDANGYQVLNKQAKVVNPYAVNWRAFSKNYFPYVIRQSTGCDNSLGLIKLNFYNPFTVYLHDTPAKSLFNQNQRYFSHGCMRVQKAMEVGHYILGDNTMAIDTLTQKGCLYIQLPITVPATETIPVFVLYHTAWTDSAAIVRFYPDIYGKFSALQ